MVDAHTITQEAQLHEPEVTARPPAPLDLYTYHHHGDCSSEQVILSLIFKFLMYVPVQKRGRPTEFKKILSVYQQNKNFEYRSIKSLQWIIHIDVCLQSNIFPHRLFPWHEIGFHWVGFLIRLWLIDGIWQQTSWSTLIAAMASCLLGIKPPWLRTYRKLDYSE